MRRQNMRNQNPVKIFLVLFILLSIGLFAFIILLRQESKDDEIQYSHKRNELYGQLRSLEDSIKTLKTDIRTIGELTDQLHVQYDAQVAHTYKLGEYNAKPSLFKTSEMEDSERAHQQWSDELKCSISDTYKEIQTITPKYNN